MALAPQLVQYQGSKRKLAPQILQYFPDHIDRLVEPFSGMAAITVATATKGLADRYWINDVNAPLVGVLKEAIEEPERLAHDYNEVWKQQENYPDGHIAHFVHIRDVYNQGDHSPAVTLYLLARCVKGAVRYKADGTFNQSPDKRRHGTRPERIAKTAQTLHELLAGKTTFTSVDYREMLPELSSSDFVYMDPPYQGVTNVRDHRYLQGVEYDDLVKFLGNLNEKQILFVLSYDGNTADKTFGKDIPESLGCKKLLLNAGTSTQATLLGENKTTFEALYLSHDVASATRDIA